MSIPFSVVGGRLKKRQKQAGKKSGAENSKFFF
jgi:hypothetical protein